MSKTPHETLTLDRIDTPVGQVLLVTAADGAVRALDFHDFEPRMLRLLTRHCGAFELVEGAAPAHVRDAVLTYFSGDAGALDQLKTRTDIHGTPATLMMQILYIDNAAQHLCTIKRQL